MNEELQVEPENEPELKITSLAQPHWAGIFFVVGFAVLLPMGLILTATTGLSSTSDVVFGIEAMAAGLLTELIFRRWLKRTLVLLKKPKIPFVSAWILLCLYVAVVRPFE